MNLLINFFVKKRTIANNINGITVWYIQRSPKKLKINWNKSNSNATHAKISDSKNGYMLLITIAIMIPTINIPILGYIKKLASFLWFIFMCKYSGPISKDSNLYCCNPRYANHHLSSFFPSTFLFVKYNDLFVFQLNLVIIFL